MANGNGGGFKMPGLVFGGGIAVSNTALLLLGVGLAAFVFVKMNKMDTRMMVQRKVMSDELKPAVIENKIAADVVANAANIETAVNNKDRIKEAIRRMEPQLKDLRDRYRDGLITRENYTAQVRSLWQVVTTTLGIPTLPPNQIPPINRGRTDNMGLGYGWGFGQYY